ncbi:MAG: preprotein translocase subunit SecA [Anaerolineae bacterium]|nr:preprotein translocase subunit SecA [Anaerolineae bacterium]
MAQGIKGLLTRFVGDSNTREISRLQKAVERINDLEPAMQALSNEQLQAKTVEFRQRLARGARLDDLIEEAFAAVREAARRTIGLRHYDVQLIGGMILHRNKIAEMKTGEGKTLVATLALYLNGLALNPEWQERARSRWGKDPEQWRFEPLDGLPVGQGAHLVTPNDYLSKFGVQWMGPIYSALGLTAGVIQSAAASPDMGSFLFDPDYASPDDRYLNLRPIPRIEAYNADVTYGTNNEFGFDYLRDNMVRDLRECVQRELVYAIIDEVDNILIDEARTPLIISGPAEESSELYRRFAEIVRTLRRDEHYEIDERTQNTTLTEEGITRVEAALPEIKAGESIYDAQHAHMLPYLDNALRAHAVYKRDKSYIVKDGQVIIVDEFTGRLMHGRRYSEGLHQAIEAKEGVSVREETLTYATITFQNFFRMYDKLAGMTGTAVTEKEEFQKIYDLDVVVLPTNVEYRAAYGDWQTRNVPVRDIEEVTFAGVLNGRDDVQVTVYETEGARYFKRLDLQDVIYGSEAAKFRALVDEISALHEAGRPVLVGTVAIETSERIARMLKRQGIPHNVLNAKYHEQEAVFIAQAGRPGAVTIATNMAGRGVDILLGGNYEGMAREQLRQEGVDLSEIPQRAWNKALEMIRGGKDPSQSFPERWAEVLAQAANDYRQQREQVVALGGLHVIGTERHEARRIDNQLRGRAGRQGDPGSSRFYLSLEDELMRRFGGERVQGMMTRAGVDDMPLEFGLLSKTIESVQTRVEGYNFDIRKHVLEYDDVVNKQREVIYAQRREVLGKDDLREQVLRMVGGEVEALLAAHCAGPDPEDWDLQGLYADLRSFIPLPPFDPHQWARRSRSEIQQVLDEQALRAYNNLSRALGHQIYRDAVQQDKTLALLRDSNDSLSRLMYQRIVDAMGQEPDDETAGLPLRRLPDAMKEQVEAGITAAFSLYHDRYIILGAVDSLWVRHLTDLSILREGIGLRAFGQQNPLVSYQKEAHEMYQGLLGQIQTLVARRILLPPQGTLPAQRRQHLQATRPRLPAAAQQSPLPRPAAASSTPSQKVGRNDPCWCGSGKKYKNCHMRQDMASQHSPTTTARPPRTPARQQRRR